MGNNGWGIILSFALVFLVIGISTVLEKKKILGEETSRKFVHIGVSNWWFLIIFLFNNMWYAIIPLIAFIILNYLSYRFNIIKSMERSEKTTSNLGTVYFPVSLLILTILSFTLFNANGNGAIIGGVGIFILGYGDGLAAIVGSKTNSRELINGKSLNGTMTMFVTSLIVAILLLVFGIRDNIIPVIFVSIVAASVATLSELYTPYGMDNLTIPIFVSLITYLILLI